jgi:excisionase family DNA binding protein
MDPILLRPAKAAQLADISRSVAYDLIARGEWPSVRVGRSLQVPVKDLLAWIDANKQSSAPYGSAGQLKDGGTTMH